MLECRSCQTLRDEVKYLRSLIDRVIVKPGTEESDSVIDPSFLPFANDKKGELIDHNIEKYEYGQI